MYEINEQITSFLEMQKYYDILFSATGLPIISTKVKWQNFHWYTEM